MGELEILIGNVEANSPSAGLSCETLPFETGSLHMGRQAKMAQDPFT